MAMVTRSTVGLAGLLLFTALLSGCSSQPNRQASVNSLIPPASTQHMSKHEARKAVVEYSIAQLGKPYKLGANSPSEGFDCSGLVFYTHLKAGKLVPRRAKEQFSSIKRSSKILPGDLVFFTTDSRGKRVDHVGIYIGQNTFIHAPGKGRPVSTANITDDYWQKRLVGAGTYWD
ncbi:MAG: C40 family peptidase [Gammaproteobacteria bacterium]|nr:C40 family peptidase [Gammaproteobacteria bacterium]